MNPKPWLPKLPMGSISISAERVDITTIDADVVALKHAQRFYGADLVIARLLMQAGVSERTLHIPVESSVLIDARGAIRARQVLLIGVRELGEFSYADIRMLSGDVLRVLCGKAPGTRRLAMTLHGPGFGLDEIECLEQQLQRFRDALQQGLFPRSLESITIAEKDADRAELLRNMLSAREVLDRGVTEDWSCKEEPSGSVARLQELAQSPSAPIADDLPGKGKIFVAMPFSKEMRDVWRYGIQQPVRNAGYICERLDEEAFTGDILSQIKDRIITAKVVIADLSGCNPNVFLEVGYAWGKGCPTLLLFRKPPGARRPQMLPFDVSGQKCIVYEDATDLEEKLSHELEKLRLT